MTMPLGIPHLLRERGLAASVAVAGLAAVMAFVGGFVTAPRREPPPPAMLEIDVRSLEGDEIFGPGQEATRPSSEAITFVLPLVVADTGPAQVRLRYAVARTAEERIEIRVNDAAIAFAAPSSDGWRDGVELALPLDAARGGDLRVSFVDALYGVAPDRADWNVGIPELVVEPIPSCAAAACLEQAERLHALGSREFEAKSLGPRNLFDAWTHLHQATLFLEAMSDETGALARTRSLRDRARAELDDRCSSLRFTVMRSVALDDRARAKRAADEIQRGFPEGRHPCHDTGKRMLALLDDTKEAP